VSQSIEQPAAGQRRGRLGRWLQVLALLVPVAIGLYFAGRTLWARHHRRAAELAFERGDFPTAQDHLRQCLSVGKDDPELHYLFSRAARRAGALDEAATALDECVRLEGRTRRVLLEEALLRAEKGALDRDTERFLWTLAQDDQSKTRSISETLVPIYIQRYEFDKAGHCLEIWLQHEPNAVRALLWRAQTLQALGSHEKAVAECRKAVQLAPDADEPRLELAGYLTMDRKMREAADLLEQVRQHQPDNATVLLGLASCRYHDGKVGEAEGLLKELLLKQPGLAAALRELGHIALDSGRLDEAERWLQEALAGDPHERDTVYFLYRCFQQQGQKARADEFFARFQKIDADLVRLQKLAQEVLAAPQNPDLRYEAALICLRNGQDAEALRWFSGALQVYPQHQPTRQALAEYYERLGKPELAAQYRKDAGQGKANPEEKHLEKGRSGPGG